jgi:hypothetical protein
MTTRRPPAKRKEMRMCKCGVCVLPHLREALCNSRECFKLPTRTAKRKKKS